MKYKFKDVLDIYNGKNQKKVENPRGQYPIFGSGGIMGYADDYICPENTVIIGRKGNINSPIFVETPFWNVDTAFGLVAKTGVLLPKYLYYFCEKYDFQKLNTTVTIPSLTKANLLQIEIDIPSFEEQKLQVSVLDKLSTLISLRKQQLAKLDELVKARFVEMFGDPVVNPMGWETRAGEALFKLSNGKAVPEQRRFSSGVPAYGGNGISWFTDSSIIDHDTIVVGRVGFQSGNVHYAEGPLWVTDNAMFISNYKQQDCDLRFLYYLMEIMNFTRFQDDGDLKKITQKPFMRAKYILPPLNLQKQYISDVEVYDRNSELIKLSLDKLETLKNALMQEYF